MTLLVGFFVYVLIWWVSLFTILPLGVARNDMPETGHDSGAPLKAEIGKKIAYTTLLATLIWVVLFTLVTIGVIDYREIVSFE